MSAGKTAYLGHGLVLDKAQLKYNSSEARKAYMSKEQSRALSPQEVILQAFVYFNVTEMDEDSLVRVSLAANCLNETLAKQVLARMVEENFLSFHGVGSN